MIIFPLNIAPFNIRNDQKRFTRIYKKNAIKPETKNAQLTTPKPLNATAKNYLL